VCGFPDKLYVIDAATNTVIANVDISGWCYLPAVHPSGMRVYVTDWALMCVWVVDTVSNSVVARIDVGMYPRGIAVNPAGTRVYVANDADLVFHRPASISVIDTATNTVIGTVVGLPGTPASVAVDPTGSRVYASTVNGVASPVIDAMTNTVIATIPVAGSSVALHPTGARIYFLNMGGVSVIDAQTYDLVATIPIGGGADAVGQFIAPNMSPQVVQVPIPTLSTSALVALSALLTALAVLGTRGLRR
jgi:YVTN family beta-propeller protein